MGRKYLLKIIFSVLLFSAFGAYAQNGKLTGKITDKKTGEELIGASVIIDGTTTAAATDLDGKFLLSLKPGTYNIAITYVSFQKKLISGVEVKANETTTLNVSLESAAREMKEVVVQAEAKKETQAALIIQQKNAASISDGISAQTIRTYPNTNTSDVLKRVSGASIQDNRFAIIRGLNERYTTAYVNGSPLPSSESDKKAFSFDIFPSNLLDNLIITKTATPNLPGEFGGGIIEINTKSVPDENFNSFTLSTGYNSITTFKDQVTYKGGKTDWLGVDDGTRALPSQIPDDKHFPVLLKEQAKLGKYMKNDWELQNRTASPNTGFQYTFGHSWKLNKEGTSRLGAIAGLTYNKTNISNTTVRRQYDSNFDPNIPVLLTEDYLDHNYVTQTLTGLLANVSYKVNANNEITFKNLASINSDDRVIIRTGSSTPNETNPSLLRSSARWFTSNQIYTGQLGGTHYVPVAKIKFNWLGAYSEVQRDIPNLRRNSYSRYKYILDPTNPDIPDYIKARDTMYKANIAQANVGPDYAGNIFYAKTNEKIYSFKGDLSHTFNIRQAHLKNIIRAGGLYQERHRDFQARQLGYMKYAPPGNLMFPDSILYLPEGQLFSPQYMGQSSPGYGGFALANKYKPSDSYSAKSVLKAGFIMFDNHFRDRYRLIWGARIEEFDQDLYSVQDNGVPLIIQTKKKDILPSANLVISLSDKKNIRIGYSNTLNRPEFRELAPFAFYDFSSRFVVSGKPSLTRALINNYDLRYEYYPGRTQLVSVSAFYKQFNNPIEQVMQQYTSGEITYQNLKTASVYGAELEARVLLGSFFMKPEIKSIWNDITIFTNLTFTKSKVDLVTNGIDSAYQIKERPLQGQSPYIINSGLQYINIKSGVTISASYNRVGARIFIVGTANEPDIWENGRDMMDIQLGKSFMKNKLEVRFNIKDLLAQKQYFFQDRDHDKKFDRNSDNKVWVSTYGQVYSLNVTYKF